MIYLYLSPFFLFAYVVIAGLAFRLMGGPKLSDRSSIYDLMSDRAQCGVFAALWPITMIVVALGWCVWKLTRIAAWVARGGRAKTEEE